ncbi:MAG TPA: hypothetical protein VKP78_09870 [bacterium]|nr:hypothetical protein [bacterium]
MVEVNKITENQYRVMVTEDSGYSDHIVILEPECYQDLTEGKISKKELIEKSFEFLLERESKESILSKFKLKQIGNYFPDFNKEIKKYWE